MQPTTKRRLALIGVLLLTQIVSACCVYPVGTRFHAIHHLAPTLPYHALAEADRRLRTSRSSATLAVGDHGGLLDGLGRLWARAVQRTL